jgi:predicted DNA-binding protein YlxM (UPF0122 family)
MRQNCTKFPTPGGEKPRAEGLTEKQARSVELCWEDRLRDAEIAQELGIHRATLARWKHLPAWQAAYQAHHTVVMQAAERKALAELRAGWGA